MKRSGYADLPLHGGRVPAWLGDRGQTLEGQAGGVGKQVAQGRAGRAGRLVEVDDALLGSDQRRERRDRLGDRGPAEDVLARPLGSNLLAVAQDADGYRLGRPALDLPKSVHGARY